MIDSPTAWLLCLIGLGTVLLWLGRVRTGRSLVSIGMLCFGLIALLPVEEWALKPLEERFQQPAADEKVDGIILLGGALESALSEDRGQPETNSAADRLLQFAALARRYPEAKLVFSGGPMPENPAGPREADWVKVLFAQLGMDTSRLLLEPDSRTTAENAMFTAKLVHPAEGERWLLVTSAWHMARSIGTFRAVGLDLIAYPVGHRSYLGPISHPYSLVERLELLHFAAHEWIGLVVYHLRGQSGDLFPAPHPAAKS